MITHRRLLPIIIALVFAGTTSAVLAATPQASIAAPSPGSARAWFLHPESSTIGAYGASPMIYANDAPIGALPANSAFYRDFPAGTYRFTVERYGIPADRPVTAQLTPGTKPYLECSGCRPGKRVIPARPRASSSSPCHRGLRRRGCRP